MADRGRGANLIRLAAEMPHGNPLPEAKLGTTHTFLLTRTLPTRLLGPCPSWRFKGSTTRRGQRFYAPHAHTTGLAGWENNTMDLHRRSRGVRRRTLSCLSGASGSVLLGPGARFHPFYSETPLRVEALESRKLLSTGVFTYHNNNQSTGVNTTETQITTANLTVSQFAKRFSTAVDGQVYAQPLYVPSLNITAGAQPGVHNTVFVATEHDSLYAIDANSGIVLYQLSFLTSGLVGATSITPAPAGAGT